MFNKNIFFRKIDFLLILIIPFLVISCATDSNNNKELNLKGEFNFKAFENAEIYSIKEREGFLLLGNESGLFAKEKTDETWLGLIDEDVSIRAFEIISESEIIAALYFNDQDSATIGRTINFGESWLPYRNGFDPDFNSTPTIIEQSENDENTIYAGGSMLRVAKSVDNAQNWDIVFGSWEGFGSIFFIESASDNVWTGGSSATFEPLLYKSADQGNTWEEISFSNNSQDIVYDIIANSVKKKIVLAGLGTGVYKSANDGEAWTNVYNQAGIITFTQSVNDPEIVYASGRNSESRLFFLASGDFGDTWQTIDYPESPTGIRVNDMVSVMESGKEVLYLGTNKGLYSFTIE